MYRKHRHLGFTLIELLVVIAVVGVLAGAVVVLINPVAMLDRARIAKGKNFQGQLTRSLGFYNVGEWNFNDASNQGMDSSGNNNNGIVTGATHIPTCDLGLGGCLSFDGTDDYMSIPPSPSLSLGTNYTVALWAYPTGYPQSDVTPLTINGNTNLALRFSNSGGIQFLAYHANGADWPNFDVLSSGSPIVLNQWNHVVVTVSGTTIKIYYNGTLNSTTDIAFTASDSTPTTSYIGIFRTYQYIQYQGMIDEVYLFNQTISQAMLQKYYAKGVMKRSLASAKK